MSYSYDPTLPTNKDRIRLQLGDDGKDGGVFLLSDEEIEAFLAASRYSEALAQLAESLAARFAQYPDETTSASGSSMKWSDRVKTWLELAKRVRVNDVPSVTSARKTPSKLGSLTYPKASESKLR